MRCDWSTREECECTRVYIGRANMGITVRNMVECTLDMSIRAADPHESARRRILGRATCGIPSVWGTNPPRGWWNHGLSSGMVQSMLGFVIVVVLAPPWRRHCERGAGRKCRHMLGSKSPSPPERFRCLLCGLGARPHAQQMR